MSDVVEYIKMGRGSLLHYILVLKEQASSNHYFLGHCVFSFFFTFLTLHRYSSITEAL